LFCALEESFSLVIPESTLTHIITLGDLYAELRVLVEEKSGTKGENSKSLRERIASTADVDIHVDDNVTIEVYFENDLSSETIYIEHPWLDYRTPFDVFANETVEITKDNFEAEVLKSDIPVLVDIWAPWCKPCREVGPIIEELANEYAGKMKIGKLNVDGNSEMAMKYQIQSIPTILIFKGGKEVQRLMGARPKPAFKKEGPMR